MTVHIAEFRLVNVDSTGRVFNKNNSTIAEIMKAAGTEQRVYPSDSVKSNAPNASGQNIVEYLQTESNNGFNLLHLDQTFIITSDATGGGDVTGGGGDSGIVESRSQIDANTTLIRHAQQYIGLLTADAAGAFQVNLPVNPQEGDVVYYKDEQNNANANNVTFNGNGNNIDQNATYVINTDSEGGTLKFEFGQWWLI
jgi:hypothetical protein